MTAHKLVIFDWDGTLMDSVAKIVASMQASAAALSINSPSEFDVRQIIGLSLPVAMNRLFPSESDSNHQNLIAQYKYQYREVITTPSPLFDNAKQLLTGLNNKNKLVAVATGKARVGLQQVWQQTNTESFFHASRCADESQSKPHPEMIESLLDELKVKPSEAIMIGDSSYDMEMARNANVDRIGVTMGVHEETILKSYQPKAIVHSLKELSTILL